MVRPIPGLPMHNPEAMTGALVNQARRGDVDAFTSLIRRYQSMAFGYAFSLLADFDQAEDATQQAFITAYRSLDKLRQPERFGGWLRSIVYFECAHVRRSRAYRMLSLTHADHIAAASDPQDHVDRDEEFGHIFGAIRSLPQSEREATILFYLQGHSQREVAVFLNVPVTTINNRLRNARKRLKKEILSMANDAFNRHDLPDSFASHVGEIIRADGPLIDAHFDVSQRPSVLSALMITEEASDSVTTVQAIQFLDDDLVRCVMATPNEAQLDTGMRVIDTGGPIRIPLQADMIKRVMLSAHQLSSSPAAVMETGIKVIDLLAPLPRRGRIALVGDMQTGKMVLVEELIHRMEGMDVELTLFIFVQSADAEINALEYRASRNVAAVYLPVADTSPEALENILAGVDAVISFSQEIALQRRYPAIDPVRSTSRLLTDQAVGQAHRETAGHVREALQNTGEASANALQEFLTQPFYVAEPYTRHAGTHVPVAETLRVCSTLL